MSSSTPRASSSGSTIGHDRVSGEVLQLVLIGSRKLDGVAALQGQEIFAIDMGLHTRDLVDVDDGRAVNPLQQIGVQFRLEFLHGFAHDVRFATGMDAHIVARSIDPFNLVLWNQGGVAAILDDQLGKLFFLQFVDATGADFSHDARVFPR